MATLVLSHFMQSSRRQLQRRLSSSCVSTWTVHQCYLSLWEADTSARSSSLQRAEFTGNIMKFLISVAISVFLEASLFNQIPQAEADTGKRVVCYYGSWAVYRPGEGYFEPENFDPFICTHGMYTFAGLDESTHEIISLDPFNDLPEDYGKGAFVRFTNLTLINPNLKVILSIGGWNEGSQKYSQMASNQNARSTFVKSVPPFLLKYGFQGLDLDWEYPTQREGKPRDKENYAVLLKELRAELDKYGLLLTAAVSAGKDTIDAAYKIPEIFQYLDFVNVMCYDYHGGTWESFTGMNAPMYALPGETVQEKYFNVNYTINYWLSLGAPPEKINLGMATYGHSYTLANLSDTTFYAPINGPGQAGPFTRESGTLGYNEICVMLQQGGWTIVRDEHYMAPYAYNGDQWIAFDDMQSIQVKCLLVNEYHLGGGMIWSIETDDFHDTCNQGYFPLLGVINEYIRGIPPSPSPPPRPSTTSQPTPSPTDVCKYPGYQADPVDCSIFYYCEEDPSGQYRVFKYTCTDGLVFDPNIDTCNYKEKVVDCHAHPTAESVYQNTVDVQ